MPVRFTQVTPRKIFPVRSTHLYPHFLCPDFSARDGSTLLGDFRGSHRLVRSVYTPL